MPSKRKQKGRCDHGGQTQRDAELLASETMDDSIRQLRGPGKCTGVDSSLESAQAHLALPTP